MLDLGRARSWEGLWWIVGAPENGMVWLLGPFVVEVVLGNVDNAPCLLDWLSR